MEKNGTPASPATARASSVLPVPGEPVSRTPRGMWAPSLRYLSGSRRKSTISASSSFASSIPATSAKVTRSVVGSYFFAFVLPKENMLPLPDCRMTRYQSPKNRIVGPKPASSVSHHGVPAAPSP